MDAAPIPDDVREMRFARAQSLLEEHLGRHAAQKERFEEFVESHRDLEAELRVLFALCGEVGSLLDEGPREAAAEQERVEGMLTHVSAPQSFSQRYEIEVEIGKGGMGAVYRVLDKKLDRPLAMKVVLGQADTTRTGRTPPIPARKLGRFLEEARITSQLDHPGIVPVHEVGVDEEGRAFFTMKLVQGRTLAEVFELCASGDPQWTTARVLGLIQRVCEAIAFAHDRGVIHRDLKPANVMVGDFGEVYVMDWGLARKLKETEPSARSGAVLDGEIAEQVTRTRDGRVLGTPAYMSPEQARGEIAQMGPQSDVYAIGAMLYQLIAGRAPYMKSGEKVSGAAILERVVAGAPERLQSGTTPPELIAITEKAMSYERAERYSSVRELGDDLQRFLDGRVVLAFRTGALEETRKWLRRNKRLASTGVFISMLALALVFAWTKARTVQAGNDRRTSRELFRDALLLEHGDAGILGARQISRDSRDRAIENLKDAVDKDPDFEEARLHLAVMLHEAGDEEGARQMIDRLRVFPVTTRVVGALSRALQQENVKGMWSPPLDNGSRPEDLVSPIDRFYFARAHQRERDKILDLVRELESDPLFGASAFFIEGVAWTTGKVHDNVQAMICFNACLALMPDMDVALQNLSSAMVQYSLNGDGARKEATQLQAVRRKFELAAGKRVHSADFWFAYGCLVHTGQEDFEGGEQIYLCGVQSCKPTLRLITAAVASSFNCWAEVHPDRRAYEDAAFVDQTRALLQTARACTDLDPPLAMTLAIIAGRIRAWDDCNYWVAQSLSFRLPTSQLGNIIAVLEDQQENTEPSAASTPGSRR